MSGKKIKLFLMIGIILMIIGIIIMFYYVENKEVKISELRNNELKVEYQTKIKNPYWIEGIHISLLGLTLIIIIYLHSKYEISKREKNKKEVN
jgi:hypothetical protein